MNNDMSQAIIPKSDQINADDFFGGPRSYVIERVAITPGTEQPVSICLAGERRVWRPCKSMSRVLVAAWGSDAKAYAGRSVTLYRDPAVKWGGLEVGGIRISHMSHIERDMLIQLTATKGKRSPHVIRPLATAKPPAPATREPDAIPGDELTGGGMLDGLPSGLRIEPDEIATLREWLDVTASDEARFLEAYGARGGMIGPQVTRIEDLSPAQYGQGVVWLKAKSERAAAR